MASSVSVEQVAAFRLAAQHVTERLPPSRLTDAARGGIQNSPPGAARVRELGADRFEAAIAEDRTLLQT